MEKTGTPTCDKLKEVDANILLRAMSSPRWTKDPKNLPLLRDINRAREEADRIGDIGLTVRFEKIKLLTTSEWLEWLGNTGEFYVITSILDGSSKVSEYTTQYFQGIKRDEFLPLGTGGMLVGFIKNPRWFIDVHMLIMESDSDIRNYGKYIEEAKKESGLDEILETIGKAVAFDPTRISQVISGVNVFLNVLAGILKSNGDDHVATIHDFYLKHQKFGEGRHPRDGLKRFQNVEVAYWIELTKL